MRIFHTMLDFLFYCFKLQAVYCTWCCRFHHLGQRFSTFGFLRLPFVVSKVVVGQSRRTKLDPPPPVLSRRIMFLRPCAQQYSYRSSFAQGIASHTASHHVPLFERQSRPGNIGEGRYPNSVSDYITSALGTADLVQPFVKGNNSFIWRNCIIRVAGGRLQCHYKH